MLNNRGSYRQIIKATSIFGGVQVVNIIINIVRSKIIAVLFGPTGMGIMGLLTSSISMVSTITNFGLGKSAIIDIAVAHEQENFVKLSKTTTVFRRLVWGTGILGILITLLLSPYLSELTFGNKNYTMAFAWLSLTLLLNQLASGQNVVLQGTHRLKLLAQANIIGSLVGLLLSIPLYYLLGLEGIVPAMIFTASATLVIAIYFARKIDIPYYALTFKATLSEGRGMLQLGFMLSLSSLITVAAAYVVRIFISRQGGIEDVGLYNAGNAIIGSYVGMVFGAMSTDYYPRLAGIAHDNKKAAQLINQQAEVAILILAPILVIFLVFIDVVIVMLYSDKFLPINQMILWAALGVYFKAVSWSMGFLILAKGASSVFFWNELISNSYILCLNIAGYYLAGLEGLGISFLIGFVLHVLQIFMLLSYKYGFSLDKGLVRLFAFQFLLGLSCFVAVRFMSAAWGYALGAVLISLSVWYSYRELDKQIGLADILSRLKS